MSDLLNDLQLMLGISEDDEEQLNLISVYLRIARQKVLNRLYPFDAEGCYIPKKYEYKVLEVAQYLYLRRGSEGETSHNENGVSRSYENADVPKSMLAEITPMTGAVK